MKWLALSLLLLLAWPLTAAAAGERVYRGDQTLTADTVWDGPVLIDGILTVPVGVTLEIRPGSVVRFTRLDSNNDDIGEHELFVQGTLLALGSAERPVTFTSAEPHPRPGDWGALNMMASEQDNRLSHCVVEYGYRGFHAHFARGVVADTVLRHNARGAQFQESTVTIERCRVVDNLNGIQFRNSTVVLRDSLVADNYWGVRCVYSDVRLERCRIENNLINGVNLRDSTLVARGNLISNNRRGLYLQRSKGTVADNLIRGNREHGTFLEDSKCDLTGNRISSNGRAGVRWVNSSGTLAGNDLSGNGEYALIDDGQGPVAAAGNWWGTANPMALQRLIRDGHDRPGLGLVASDSPLTAPPLLEIHF